MLVLVCQVAENIASQTFVSWISYCAELYDVLHCRFYACCDAICCLSEAHLVAWELAGGTAPASADAILASVVMTARFCAKRLCSISLSFLSLFAWPALCLRLWPDKPDDVLLLDLTPASAASGRASPSSCSLTLSFSLRLLLSRALSLFFRILFEDGFEDFSRDRRRECLICRLSRLLPPKLAEEKKEGAASLDALAAAVAFDARIEGVGFEGRDRVRVGAITRATYFELLQWNVEKYFDVQNWW